MTSQNSVVPIWFWVISVIALLWNAMGCWAYWAEVNQTPETLAAMNEAVRNLYAIRPAWATSAFAIAVFAGLIGCILLLMRKRLANMFFIVSLLGLIAQNYYSFVVARVQDVYTSNVIALPVVVFVVAVLLLLFSRSSTAKGWLQ